MTLRKLQSLKNKRAIKYVVAGAWNTFFGYFSSVLIYYYFKEYLGVVGTGIVANILSISMSFLTFKIFVFKTHGSWIGEYFRSFLVYGLNALLGVTFLYIGVSILNYEFWIVQAIAIILLTLVSYFGHSFFTFKVK